MDDWKKRLDDLFQKKAAYEQKLAEDRQNAVPAHAQQFSLVAALFDSTINPAFEVVRSELLKHGSEPNIVLRIRQPELVPDWPVHLRSTKG